MGPSYPADRENIVLGPSQVETWDQDDTDSEHTNSHDEFSSGAYNAGLWTPLYCRADDDAMEVDLENLVLAPIQEVDLENLVLGPSHE